jgi:hypothetical protein
MDLLIYSASGQLIYSRELSNIKNNDLIEVDISAQANGVYFVHLQLGDTVWRQKLILDKNF